MTRLRRTLLLTVGALCLSLGFSPSTAVGGSICPATISNGEEAMHHVMDYSGGWGCYCCDSTDEFRAVYDCDPLVFQYWVRECDA
jgi:hypothetical protein